MKNRKNLIDDFCKIILTENDFIDKNLADAYITSLKGCLSDLNSIDSPKNNREIRLTVLNNLMSYMRKYQEAATPGKPVFPPFSFDSGSNYDDYRNYFIKKFKETYENSSLPPVFDFAFDYIQEVSEHYRIFSGFYDARSKETKDVLLSKAKSLAQDAIREKAIEVSKTTAKTAAQEATRYATILATKAKKSAQQAQISAHKAELDASNAAKDAVDGEITKLTMKMSDSSVTILGIFAGIVLTVVAGLFYSSSVINNITSADFHRLISVSALVGFICFNLISLMFYYIERIRNSGKTTASRFSYVIGSVNIVLIIIMIVFAFLK